MQYLISIVEISVLAVAYYYLFLFVRGTRGAQILVGLIILLLILIGLTKISGLEALNWILRQISLFFGIAILIIFQPEIRGVLAELGRRSSIASRAANRASVGLIVKAVSILAEHRVGALIAIEREIGTRSIIETGIEMDAKIVPELLASIFYPHTPLHDGGVIIRNNRIVAAGCLFPLSQNADLHKSLGTRHRAALGLSEETDAVVVVVSEETGSVSVCYKGRLMRGLDEEKLERFLSSIFKKSAADSPLAKALDKLDLTADDFSALEDNHNEAGIDRENI